MPPYQLVSVDDRTMIEFEGIYAQAALDIAAAHNRTDAESTVAHRGKPPDTKAAIV